MFVSYDGRYLYTAVENVIKIWNMYTLKLEAILDDHKEEIQ
jgi:hypothetical protein